MDRRRMRKRGRRRRRLDNKIVVVVVLVILCCGEWWHYFGIAEEVAEKVEEEKAACLNDCLNQEMDQEMDQEVDQEEEMKISSPWAFMKAFSKLGTSWSQVWGEYASVVASADGKDVKGDLYARDWEEALQMLRELTKQAAEEEEEMSESSEEMSEWPSHRASHKSPRKWSFENAPLEDLGKSSDDVLAAFLRWSAVDSQPGDSSSCQLLGGTHYSSYDEPINVSKAFRRLSSYITWMDDMSPHLSSSPITAASISSSLSAFSIHFSHDACHRLVWWVHLGQVRHQKLLKQQPPEEDTLRMFVYIAHKLFLDEQAQNYGLVVVDDMAHVAFWEYMTMLPLQVGIAIDRFLIGVTPLKVKNVVLMHRPAWVSVAYKLLSWCLTEKMKKRVTMVDDGQEQHMLVKVVGGAEFVPKEFGRHSQ